MIRLMSCKLFTDLISLFLDGIITLLQTALVCYIPENKNIFLRILHSSGKLGCKRPIDNCTFRYQCKHNNNFSAERNVTVEIVRLKYSSSYHKTKQGKVGNVSGHTV